MCSALLFGGLAASCLGTTLAALHHLRWAKRLPPWDPGDESSRAPVRCSVIIAARDEEARIEATINHALAQRGVEIELIVVDDRSTDQTGEILKRRAAKEPRLRGLRVDVLPDGWLGKCHACHIAAGAATGEWLLFTDADCWLKPDVVVRALAAAGREGVDHVTLTPGVAPETLGARAWHVAFLLTLSNWFSGVNRDRPDAYLGMGAFNLVRKTAYNVCGGHEALRLTVVDDIKLGLLLRRAGKRTRGFIGGDDTECHWGTTVRSMIKIMEKNYFAAIDYRTLAAFGSAVIGTTGWAAAFVGPFTGTTAGLLAGLGLLSLVAPAAVVTRRLGWSLTTAMLTPFIFPALFYAVLNSTWVTLRQGGVRWRETFYPLAALRAGNVQQGVKLKS